MMDSRRGRALDCRQMEALLPPFVDGLAKVEDRVAVADHLAACPACRAAMECQSSVRALLRQRCETLRGTAPSDLSATLRRHAASGATRSPGALSWHGRWSALAAAAACVMAFTAALMWGTSRSSVLLAAQLTLDHLKCFMIDGDAGTTALSPGDVAARMTTEFGRSTPVPAPVRDDVRLVAVRRCLYAEGIVPHVLYRSGGDPVSLFILPRAVAAATDVSTFGRHAEILVRGDVTYVIVAPDRLGRMSAALGLEAE